MCLMICEVLHDLYNLENVKNTHGGECILLPKFFIFIVSLFSFYFSILITVDLYNDLVY